MARALLIPCAQRETLNPGGTLIFSTGISPGALGAGGWAMGASGESASSRGWPCFQVGGACWARDRKSTRLNSSHLVISYAVFCLKKKKQIKYSTVGLDTTGLTC